LISRSKAVDPYFLHLRTSSGVRDTLSRLRGVPRSQVADRWHTRSAFSSIGVGVAEDAGSSILATDPLRDQLGGLLVADAGNPGTV